MLFSFLSRTLCEAKVSAPYKRGRSRFNKSSGDVLGNWIWFSDNVSDPNCYAYFRRALKLDSRPKRATICVAACSKYKLYINGEYIGRGPARAPLGVHYYDIHDITGVCVQGENLIALIVHYFGVDTYAGPVGKPGLNCRIEVELESGNIQIPTDESWLACRADEWTDCGERINESLGFQEVYDSSLRIVDWNKLTYSDKALQNASVVKVDGVLLPRPIPLLAETAVLPESVLGLFNSPPRESNIPLGELPQAIACSPLTELKYGSVNNWESLLRKRGSMYVRTPRNNAGVAVILDFGREVFGNLEVRIPRCSRGYVDIAYSEVLEEGRVQPDRGSARYVDRIILSKAPIEWQSFEPRAFRYVQLEFRGLGRGAAIDYVRLNKLSYPVRRTGKFECSDPLLNRIWETAAYTGALCMEDSFVASPAFDRRLNWADVYVQARAAYYAFGDTALLAKALKDVARTQDADGRIAGVGPDVNGKSPVDLMLLWVASLLDYYAFSGDKDLVQELYPCVNRLIRWFDRFAGSDSLLRGVPGYLALDSCDICKALEGESASLNSLYSHALRIAGILAEICGCQEDAEDFSSRANELKLAVNRLFYVSERGLYASGRLGGNLVEEYGLLENVFAVLFDVADHYRKSAILRQVASGAFAEYKSPLLASYVLQALYSHDMHSAALEIIRRKWGDMLEQGATAFWECFDGRSPMCRGWSVCPASDLISEYVGIKPSLGAHRFSIVPHVADLKWARGSVDTPNGPLVVEWRAKITQLVIRVDVPSGVIADLFSPGGVGSRVCLDGKPQPSRLMTLDCGTHVITVTSERKSSRSKSDTGPQPQPQPHVEVLGEAYRSRTERRRSARLLKHETVGHRSRQKRTKRITSEDTKP